MHNYAITIKNATFGYNEENPVLKNISLEIPVGKIVAIMGGSGSGKTTLLSLISGQNKPQNGNIEVLGQDLLKLKPSQLLDLRKKFGMLFQFGALFTDMSVYENIAFSLNEHTNLPKSIIEKIVAMKLHAVGLFGTQNLMPQELSGGMSRRIALARAMALDPQLMLYDEPFTGLDPIALNIIAMLIKKISSHLEQTAILVTHNIELSMQIVDYVYFMENGEIIADGSPKEIYNTTNPAVRQFIDGSIDGPFKYQYPTTLKYLN